MNITPLDSTVNEINECWCSGQFVGPQYVRAEEAIEVLCIYNDGLDNPDANIAAVWPVKAQPHFVVVLVVVYWKDKYYAGKYDPYHELGETITLIGALP